MQIRLNTNVTKPCTFLYLFVSLYVWSLSKGKATPVQAYYRPKEIQEFEAPKFWDNRHMKVCQHNAPAAFTPRKYSWYSFLLEAERCQSHSAVGRTMSMKSSNDTIGNRTQDLPACDSATLPTATPRATDCYLSFTFLTILHKHHLQL